MPQVSRRAKDDTVHNRRMIAKDINDKEIIAKLFTDIAPRSNQRNGGYTRVLKLGRRRNDAAEMAILELVDKGETEEKPKKEEQKQKEETS